LPPPLPPRLPPRRSAWLKSYATPSLIGSLILSVVAAVAWGMAGTMRWIEIPPSSAAERADAGSSSIDEPSERAGEVIASPSARQFWPLLAAVPVLASVGALVPARPIRGGILLAVTLACAVAWFVLMRRLQMDLLRWSPLARYVQAPDAFGGRPPQPAAIGMGMWVMLGAIAAMACASAINLCRAFAGALLVVGSVAGVAALGYVYVAAVYGYPKIGVEVLEVTSGGAGRSTSATVAALCVRNRTSRPLVLVPAEAPEPGSNGEAGDSASEGGTREGSSDVFGSGSSLPGQWTGKGIGRPDLILQLRREGVASTGKGFDRKAVSITFREEQRYGCLIKPQEEVRILIRFAPDSDSGSSQRDALAGDWSVSFLDADRKSVASTEAFSVPGAASADDGSG
jgi:hypothetical protein